MSTSVPFHYPSSNRPFVSCAFSFFKRFRFIEFHLGASSTVTALKLREEEQTCRLRDLKVYYEFDPWCFTATVLNIINAYALFISKKLLCQGLLEGWKQHSEESWRGVLHGKNTNSQCYDMINHDILVSHLILHFKKQVCGRMPLCTAGALLSGRNVDKQYCTMNAAARSATCMQRIMQVTVSSPGARCPLRPGGCSVPGCRSAWCRSCWWSAAVSRRGPPGPAAPRWTAAAALWHWPHVPPSPGGTGRSGPLPWGAGEGKRQNIDERLFKLVSVISHRFFFSLIRLIRGKTTDLMNLACGENWHLHLFN